MARTVGVIICVYNGADHVGQALASVASQRRAPDAVVVVDDGSTDDTVARVQRWAGLLPLQLKSHPTNLGLGAARRSAVEMLSTDLVSILDADDVWLPDHLDLLLALYEERGGIVTANALRWVEGGAVGWQGNADRHPVPPAERQLHALLRQNFLFICTLFQRDLYHQVGGFRPLASCEDWDLWIRMVEAGAVVQGQPIPTVLYRLRREGLSGVGDDRLAVHEKEVLRRFIEETSDPVARDVARRSIQDRVARQAVGRSWEAAAQGKYLRARLEAVQALRGTSTTRMRAAAMVLAPRQASRLRRKLQSEPRWLVRQ